MARFKKKSFNLQEFEIFKHILIEGRVFRDGSDKENEENVARMRNCCRFPSSPPSPEAET